MKQTGYGGIGRGKTVPERTIVLGFLAGSAAGFLAYAVGAMVWAGSLPSRYQLGFASVLLALGCVLSWFIAAAPFALVRVATGGQWFATAPRIIIAGTLIGAGTIPFWVLVYQALHESAPPPFLPTLLETIASRWPLYVLSGAAGGLVYWLIECSPVPVALWALARDSLPVRWTGNLLSRRLVAAVLSVAIGAVAIFAAIRWWQPHVIWSPHSGVPRIHFAGEWDAHDWPEFLIWSADGSKLVALLGIPGRRMLVASPDGSERHEVAGPNNAVSNDAVSNGQEIIVPSTGLGPSFTAFSVATGKLLHKGPRGGVLIFVALSGDGRTLAVAYGGKHIDQPIKLYATSDWRQMAAPDLSLPSRQGAGHVALSARGDLVAFGYARSVVIADWRAGKVVRTIPFQPLAIAFSPDGSLIAVTALDGGIEMTCTVRIFRLNNGSEIASHPVEGCLGPRILWDPRGRFVLFSDLDKLHVWNPLAGSAGAAIGLRPHVFGFALSPDGNRLAVGSGSYISLFRLD